MRVFFDESDQRVTHLLDLDQPNFCLGSTNVDKDEALELPAGLFPVLCSNLT